MNVIPPTNVPLSAQPSWADDLSAALNDGLFDGWDFGQRTKTIAISAAQLGLSDFAPEDAADLDNHMNEYRAGGWIIALVSSVTGPSGRATFLTYEFARWEDNS